MRLKKCVDEGLLNASLKQYKQTWIYEFQITFIEENVLIFLINVITLGNIYNWTKEICLIIGQKKYLDTL